MPVVKKKDVYRIIVIGDSMADLGMANAAAVDFIAVKTGLYTDVFIQDSTNIIEDLTQLRVKT